MKYRLESKTKTADFHWIFHFDAIADQSNTSPVFFCKPCVVVSVKRRPLFEHFSKRYMRESSVTVGGLYDFLSSPYVTYVIMSTIIVCCTCCQIFLLNSLAKFEKPLGVFLNMSLYL